MNVVVAWVVFVSDDDSDIMEGVGADEVSTTRLGCGALALLVR